MEEKKSQVGTIRNIQAIDDEYLMFIAETCSNHPHKTYKEISSEVLGQAETYIYDLRSRYPQLKEFTKELTKDKFDEMARAAQAVVWELMYGSENDNVRLASAKEFMSRGGYDAVAKVENTNKDITVELVDDETDDQ